MPSFRIKYRVKGAASYAFKLIENVADDIAATARFDKIMEKFPRLEVLILDVEEMTPAVWYRHELACHDWHYNYSDDHNVWKRGRAHMERIKSLRARAIESGEITEAEADDLWNSAAPVGHGLQALRKPE